MTKPKPLPEIARCACGRAATIQTIQTSYSKEYWIVCDHYKCFNGPWRATVRGAILAWNRVMESERRAMFRLCYRIETALESGISFYDSCVNAGAEINKIRRGE